jgi:hypothetical protein
MENSNVTILVDAKTEYTKQLINMIKNVIYQGIKKIYNEAKLDCLENGNTLSKFQEYLSKIPKWNQDIINTEYEKIIIESKCDWLEDLLTAVFVSHTRILTSINFSKNKKKINLKIPKVENFIHQCYIDIARYFWKMPYLFDDNVSKFEYQRNRREAEIIIENSIGETIRKQLPVKHILKEYLGGDYDEHNDEHNQEDNLDDIDNKYKENLKKIVKNELENFKTNSLFSENSNTSEVLEQPQENTTIEPAPQVENIEPTPQVENIEPTPQVENIEPTPQVEENNVTETLQPVQENTEIETLQQVQENTEIETVPQIEENTEIETVPQIEENIVTKILPLESNEEDNEINMELLDLDNNFLGELDTTDLEEVNFNNTRIIEDKSIENIMEGNLQEYSTNTNNNSEPIIEKKDDNIKNIILNTENNNDINLKKELLKKYMRKRDYSFFEDASINNDEE